MRCQVSAGPWVHSMKKQGPPPWGMNRVGCRGSLILKTFDAPGVRWLLGYLCARRGALCGGSGLASAGHRRRDASRRVIAHALEQERHDGGAQHEQAAQAEARVVAQ